MLNGAVMTMPTAEYLSQIGFEVMTTPVQMRELSTETLAKIAEIYKRLYSIKEVEPTKEDLLDPAFISLVEQALLEEDRKYKQNL